MVRKLLVVVAAVSMSGCLASGVQLTKDRATFDLGCPKDQIDVVMLSGLTERGTGSVFGAQGCGKKATYVRHEAAGVTLNSPIQEKE
ncbi:hypothetical protein KRR26_15295 [Corallococcus sp. M34]|uniref:hypothetical protein n=1 Tax=Citreicoccus inhibens TaxID=2849499 RepID=UPI0011C39471|nr:hypothetical protein [Citreicoccus inhibens]MBU8896984.1 hypothetical protein [Citreicoccus inhibens]